jgi:hypothetical protein
MLKMGAVTAMTEEVLTDVDVVETDVVDTVETATSAVGLVFTYPGAVGLEPTI